MGDLLRWLQVVMTWSYLIGLLSVPVGLLCFTVAATRLRLRFAGAGWGLTFLWPWHVYAWAAGIVLCFSGWGWLGVGVLFATSILGLGHNALFLGIAEAFRSGRSELGSELLVICVGLLAARLAASWLMVHSPEGCVGRKPLL